MMVQNMSRLEKNLKNKKSKKKYKSRCRIVFVFFMMIITVGSILLIDYRINDMLDEPSKNTLTKYINTFFK